MRTLIFALLLAGNLFAQPTPREWINQFTTNRPPMAIRGSNDVAITNVSTPWQWDFYGINFQTVARLNELNVTSNGVVNLLTNRQVLTNNGLFTFPIGTTISNTSPWEIRKDGSLFIGSNVWQESQFLNLAGVNPIYAVLMTESNEPSAMNLYNAVINNENYDYFAAWEFNIQNDKDNPTCSLLMRTANTNGDVGIINLDASPAGGFSMKLSNSHSDIRFFPLGGLFIQSSEAHHPALQIINFDSGDDIFTVTTNGTLKVTSGGITNSGPLDVVGGASIYGSLSALSGIGITGGGTVSGALKFPDLTASRLAAFSATTTLTNSLYSDADIAAIIAGLGNTNLYVLNNAGKGTNNTFYSPTNTAQASNQVCQVISMLAGQKTNAWEVWSNGVLISFVASSGCYTNTALISKISNVQLNQGGVILSANNKALQIGVGGPAVGGIGNNFQLVLNDGNGTGDRLLTLFGGINYPGFSNSVNGLELRAGNSSSFTNLLVQNLTTKGTIYAPTNTAPFFTTNFSTLLVTNLALPQRALLFVQLAFDDVTGGIPSCTVIATNTVSTNNFGSISPTLSGLTLVGTVTITNHYTYPLDTNQVIKFTDTSSGGAAVRMIQSILFGL